MIASCPEGIIGRPAYVQTDLRQQLVARPVSAQISTPKPFMNLTQLNTGQMAMDNLEDCVFQKAGAIPPNRLRFAKM
jgi:hypothetical protein